jgi:hypothetical protein
MRGLATACSSRHGVAMMDNFAERFAAAVVLANMVLSKRHSLVLITFVLVGLLSQVAQSAVHQPASKIKIVNIESSQLTFVMRVDLSAANDQGRLDVALPIAAHVVITDVKVGDGRRWYPSSFGAADKVVARFFASLGTKVGQPGPVMVSREQNVNYVTIDSQYYPKSIPAIVEITGSVPLCHDQGKWIASLLDPDPIGGVSSIDLAAARIDTVAIKGASVMAPADVKAMHSMCETSGLTLTGPWQQPNAIVASYGQADVSPDVGASMVTLDLSAQLVPFYDDTHVVFVVDTSRSLPATQLTKELALIDGYMAMQPAGKYQVIAFARQATALFDKFENGIDGRAKLAAIRSNINRRNGSHLDAALALAKDVLRGAKHPRVVIFTDADVRSRLKPADIVAAQFSRETIVHALLISQTADLFSAGYELLASNDELLDAVVLPGGGLTWSMAPASKRTMQATVGAMISPTEMTDLTLNGKPMNQVDNTFNLSSQNCDADGETLTANAGYRWLASRPLGAKVTLAGKLWSAPWTTTLQPDPRLTATTAAITSTAGRVPEDALLALSMLGHSLTSATAYLAEPNGKVPDLGQGGGGGLGRSNCGCGAGSIGYGSGTGTGGSLPLPLLSDVDLQPIVQRCQSSNTGKPQICTFKVESKHREIVDIIDLAACATPALTTCLRDGLWDVLVDDPRMAQYQSVQFTVGPTPTAQAVLAKD